MRRKSSILCIILLFTIRLYSQGTGVHFTDNLSWKQVKEKAKKENKYIFIDVYATWCGPCKAMDAQVYPEAAIGHMLNEKFISIKVQKDQTMKDDDQIKAWYNDAITINQQYHIETLPSYLFFNADGKLIHRGAGYKDTSGFLQMVNVALSNPIAKLQKQLADYKKGKRDSAFLRDLVFLASGEEDQSNTSIVASTYIISIKDPFTTDNLDFIQRFTQKSTDPGFGIFYKNMDKVNEILGKNQAERLVRKVIGKEEIDPYLSNKNATPDWDSLAIAVKRKYGSIGEEKVYGARMLYHLDRNEWDRFGKAYEQYYLTAISHSEYHINNISWKVFQHVTDPQVLAVAIKATKYNIENYSKDNPMDMDTYANLLYKAGVKDEAIRIEEKAVELSKQNKELIQTLNKMRKGEPTWPVNN